MTNIANFNPEDYSALVNRWLKAEQEGERFPVDFDIAWQIAGYARKDIAKRRLSNLREGIDFSSDRSIVSVGRPAESILLTFNGFVAFCLLAECQNSVRSALFDYILGGKVNIDWGNPQAKDKSGFVYLVKQAYTPYYKIGCSKKPYQRLRSLQVGNPLEIKIIERVFSLDCYALEKDLHDYYQSYAVRGEWFDLPDEIVKEFYQVAHDLDKTREQSCPELTSDCLSLGFVGEI